MFTEPTVGDGVGQVMVTDMVMDMVMGVVMGVVMASEAIMAVATVDSWVKGRKIP